MNPPAGTGWFRASLSTMFDRLLLFLLNRLFSFVQNYSFGPPFGLPLFFLMIGTDTALTFDGHYSLLLYKTDRIDFPGLDFCHDISSCRRQVHEEPAFDGNTLTGFPYWRNN